MLEAPVPEQLVWARVTRPAQPLVYLDLNHYIQLAKASRAEAGFTSEDGRAIKVLPGYSDLLASARRAKADGRALFPLSAVHFMEVAHRVPSPRQRGHVADIMEELSSYLYLAGRPTMIQVEVAAGVDKVYGVASTYQPVPLLQDSAMWAFGRTGGFKFLNQGTGEDLEAQIRRAIGDEAFEKQLAEMRYILERKVLEGPQDSEIPNLRRNGYLPENYGVRMQSRLDFELETRTILDNDPALRRQRLRDHIFAREVAHECMTLFALHLRQREEEGLRHDLLDPPDLVALFAAMPQLQVSVTMKARYHQNPQHPWKVNHISDIDALCVAFAYCDAVLTDAEARAAIAGARELRGFGTFLPAKPIEMARWLDGLPAQPNGTDD
ncbi:hypothetical protein ncot_10980 [Nocardioides sp. JQ2195]|uniref:hypothetical protein n=1 Tax=Nocardioides sp. JQ2195 TaxID=2592334 RepID=UPI00143EA2FA|nr:hypothetical protein [Nocardioides sp. JQ2195]QIX27060.1 hypothetical protein ncot_10980 [Nocardioides sp. JQ2195]